MQWARPAAIAAVLLGGAATAAEPPPSPRTSVTIVELPRGAPYIGFPLRCPGAPQEPEEAGGEEEEPLCFAELYQGGIEIVRHLGGPRLSRNSRLRLTAHARHWGPGTRLLVATQPFNDKGVRGHFAYWWSTPEWNGDFCEPEEELERWPDEAVRAAFAKGYRKRFRAFGYIEKANFRCIRD